MVKPLKAGMLLSRAPVVTPAPAPFAQYYYRYMAELEKRLMWTFPSYFYFKRGTLSQRKFNDLQKGPMAPHKDIYFPSGVPDVHHNRDRRFKDTVTIVPDEQEQITHQPLTTGKEDDTTSLARKLDKTLYLVVKEGKWAFPSFEVADDAASLDEAAETGLRELGGEFMNVWTVSNTPAAVVRKPSSSTPEFLMKSHILHGQFTPQKAGTEFAWLTKEEIKNRFDGQYYDQVEALL